MLKFNPGLVLIVLGATGPWYQWKPCGPICVDFREEGKPKYPEKNPRSTGEINYEEPRRNMTHMCRKPFFGFLGGDRHDTLTACLATRAPFRLSCFLMVPNGS